MNLPAERGPTVPLEGPPLIFHESWGWKTWKIGANLPSLGRERTHATEQSVSIHHGLVAKKQPLGSRPQCFQRLFSRREPGALNSSIVSPIPRSMIAEGSGTPVVSTI